MVVIIFMLPNFAKILIFFSLIHSLRWFPFVQRHGVKLGIELITAFERHTGDVPTVPQCALVAHTPLGLVVL